MQREAKGSQIAIRTVQMEAILNTISHTKITQKQQQENIRDHPKKFVEFANVFLHA